MSEDYIEMNECEKLKLLDISKKSIKEKFRYIKKKDWKTYFECIKNNDVLTPIAILLDARKDTITVKCSFDNNRYVDNDNMHKLLIYGEEKIDLNYDNVLAIIPNDSFKYLYDDEDITDSFVQCMDILGIDSYSGKFMYAGIVNEESGDLGFASLDFTELINETTVYMIDEDSAIWKRYFAESYRLYESEQYKLAFLHSFIGFESLIEYLNRVLFNVYLNEQNELLNYELENYNKSVWTPVSFIDNHILKTQSYQRLKHLENENRKLIKDKLVTIIRYVNDMEKKPAESKIADFTYYVKFRDVLAHGDSCEREDLKQHPLYKKYYNVKESKFDFELIYRDFFEHIGNLIKELVD